MSLPWFRMYWEFATDPKVQMLSEANQRRFIMLLCLKCCNGDVTLSDEHVAFQLRIDKEEWMQSKAILLRENLIDENNKPVSWDKRQARSDSSTARVAKFREKKKQTCNAKVTPQDIDIDIDIDIEKEKKKSFSENKKIDPAELLRRYGISGQLASDFIDYKKGKNAPITKTTLDGFVAEAGKAGISIQQAIEVTLLTGWGSFNSEWYRGYINANNNKHTSRREHSEKIGRELEELVSEEFGEWADYTAVH